MFYSKTEKNINADLLLSPVQRPPRETRRLTEFSFGYHQELVAPKGAAKRQLDGLRESSTGSYRAQETPSDPPPAAAPAPSCLHGSEDGVEGGGCRGANHRH